MRILATFLSISLLISHTSNAQYFPDDEWQRKSASALKMNQELVDSALSVAKNNENAVNRDLRIAIMEAFSREPNFKILGKVKERGGPAGLIIKDGYI